MRGAARLAKANGEVAYLIHRDAAHPQRSAASAECPVLKHRRRAVWRANFVPAYARGCCSGLDGEWDTQGLMSAEISVCHSELQSIAQGVELLGRAPLRNASKGGKACRRERWNSDRAWSPKSRIARRHK